MQKHYIVQWIKILGIHNKQLQSLSHSSLQRMADALTGL